MECSTKNIVALVVAESIINKSFPAFTIKHVSALPGAARGDLEPHKTRLRESLDIKS